MRKRKCGGVCENAKRCAKRANGYSSPYETMTQSSRLSMRAFRVATLVAPSRLKSMNGPYESLKFAAEGIGVLSPSESFWLTTKFHHHYRKIKSTKSQEGREKKASSMLANNLSCCARPARLPEMSSTLPLWWLEYDLLNIKMNATVRDQIHQM